MFTENEKRRLDDLQKEGREVVEILLKNNPTKGIHSSDFKQGFAYGYALTKLNG